MTQAYRREISVALALAVLLILLRIFAPAFYNGDQIRARLVENAPVLIAAIGMSLVILARQIDISIGSQFCIAGMIAGALAKSGLPMPLVTLITLAAGAVMGSANGALVAFLNLPSIVVTLATMVIFRQSLAWKTEGEFVRNLPPGFQWFGLSQTAGQRLIVAVALLIFAFFAWSMCNLSAGRAIYATGSDAEAARLAGIRPRRVTFVVFTIMGMLTAVAALMSAIRFADVDPNFGTGLELQVIAAVVVGGIAISGGRGTLVGSLIGVALLGIIGPALVHLKTQAYWEKAIQGAIILLAVASDAIYERER